MCDARVSNRLLWRLAYLKENFRVVLILLLDDLVELSRSVGIESKLIFHIVDGLPNGLLPFPIVHFVILLE